MANLRHTFISCGIAIAVALLLLMADMGSGPAFMLGAVAGIGTSVLLQRRAVTQSAGPLGGSEEPGDIDAANEAAHVAVRSLPDQVAAIEDPATREVAQRTSEALGQILETLGTDEKRGLAPLLVDQLIEPAQALLTDYLWLQKRPESTARDAMTKIALSDLPAAEHSARQVQALLNRPGPVDVAAIRRAVDFQFSFGGETVIPEQELWGNRQEVVRAAEREN